MGLDLADYDLKAASAVSHFWRTRQEAIERQRKSGTVDQGERAAVTAGKNMDGFLTLIHDVIVANGLSEAHICVQQRLLTLPGYFRPTKLWDLLVVNEGRLVAVVELKSQVGPSFGNNFNNRAEEAIGSAQDFWIAFREGAFRSSSRPFLGWLMLVEDCEQSRAPRQRIDEPHFTVFPEFCDASYADQYEILCRKLIQEQLYTAACLLLSPRDAVESGVYSELSEETGLRNFVATLAGHIAVEAAKGLQS